MKFKLDENFGPTIEQVFVSRGHDCRSVRSEDLCGAADELILERAIAEERILVTMDRDFGNILVYPPASASGIAILDPRGRASTNVLKNLAETLLAALLHQSVRGKLWIIEPSRIREHESDDKIRDQKPKTES